MHVLADGSIEDDPGRTNGATNGRLKGHESGDSFTNGHTNGHVVPVAMSRGNLRPPGNPDIEAALLGSILLDSSSLDEVVSIVDPADFLRSSHEVLAGIFWSRHSSGVPIDPVLISEELRRCRLFDGSEADLFLGSLMERAVLTCDSVYYAKMVKVKSISRKLIQAGEEMTRDGYLDLYTAEELLARADSRVFSIAEKMVGNQKVHDSVEVIDSVFERIDLRMGGVTNGVTTGFIGLDSIVNTLRDANLSVLAARPAMGKTAIALNIASHVAFQLQISTLFFSLEMESGDLGERLLASLSNVFGRKFEDPSRLSEIDVAAMGQARTKLVPGFLSIDDCSCRTVSQINATCRLHQKRKGLGFVVIDYLSLIDGQPRRGESRQEEVARMARELKAVARNLNIPILLLCQLNREVEKRGDGRPRLSDLRESGQIEQEASVVMMLHRKFENPDEAEIVVAKNRFGRTGIAKLAFNRECTRFENPADGAIGGDEDWTEQG